MTFRFRQLPRRAISALPKWIRWALLTGFAVIFVLIFWGVGIEPRLVSEEHEVAEIPGLPEVWQEQHVALIADLQVGMWLANTDTIGRVVARLVEMRPAAVLIAGDFIYHPLEDEPEDVRDEFEPEEFKAETIEEARKVADLLRPLTAGGIPTYAVLGNHDYGIKNHSVAALPALADRVQTALEEIGISVLRNEAIPMADPRGGQERTGGSQPGLYLVGIGSRLAQQDDPIAAMARVPDGAPRLVLMHHPASFLQLPAGAAPLAFAGHTHGGQVRIPFFPTWSIWNLIKEEELPMDGWIRNYGQPGNRLYVTRGIGFSVLPLRINCPPQLTMFTLRRAQ